MAPLPGSVLQMLHDQDDCAVCCRRFRLYSETHTANSEVRMQEMCTGVSIGFGNPDNNSSYVHPSDWEII